MYDEANSTFIEDKDMQERLMEANPNSFRKLVRALWGPSPYASKQLYIDKA